MIKRCGPNSFVPLLKHQATPLASAAVLAIILQLQVPVGASPFWAGASVPRVESIRLPATGSCLALGPTLNACQSD